MSDLQPGDRIELVEMVDDPDPIPVGTTGTVENVVRDPMGDGRDQVWVAWDIDRTLMLVVPPDRYKKL